MDNFDFALFYDNQPDYAAFRSDEAKRLDYTLTADWKARNLVRLIPSDIKVKNLLEVGCAFGVLLNMVGEKIHAENFSGIDISRENIKVAQELFPAYSFFNGTLDEFIKNIDPIRSGNKYDIILLSDIVEHIPNDLEFLKKVRDISSYVLLNLPLERSFKNRNRNYGEQDPSGHLRCYDKNMAVRLVNSAGFEIVTSFTSIASSDKQFYEMYKKNRTLRVRKKPFHLRLFWSFFYYSEDKLKMMNRRITERIYGTNYFALLKSVKS
jgi:predicted TPR repeat methyltransferase